MHGKCYSRIQIKQWKWEFDKIDSINKGFVTIDEYIKYVSETPSIKKIAVSLFNFFDGGLGVITFKEILEGMIPHATEDQVKKMLKWV